MTKAGNDLPSKDACFIRLNYKQSFSFFHLTFCVPGVKHLVPGPQTLVLGSGNTFVPLIQVLDSTLSEVEMLTHNRSF